MQGVCTCLWSLFTFPALSGKIHMAGRTFPARRDDRILIEVLCLPDPIPSTLIAHFSNIPGKF